MNKSSSIAHLFQELRTFNPSYFSFVMATGIISVAAHFLGMTGIAEALLWFNVFSYILLWTLVVVRIIFYFSAVKDDFLDHFRCVGFFTTIAATSVLGSQFLVIYGEDNVAFGLAVAGLVLWAVLIYTIFTILTMKRQKPDLAHGIHGGWLLAVVATQSIAVVTARLAIAWHGHDPALLLAASMWLGGGMLYVWMISLIFYRYTFFSLGAEDIRPPYWINMGAVAISTLAGAILAEAAPQAPFLMGLLPFIKGVTLMFWATATGWIPMLIIMGFWRHVYYRIPLRYDPSYWGAVFPLGMYTAATWRLADAIELPFIKYISQVFIWIAIAAWVVTFIGLLRTMVRMKCEV